MKDEKIEPLTCGHDRSQLVKGNVRRDDEGDCAICLLHTELSIERKARERAEEELRKVVRRCMQLEHKILDDAESGLAIDFVVAVEDAHDTWDLAGHHYICGCHCQCGSCPTDPSEEER